MVDYWSLRNELAQEPTGSPGVISVGIGRSSGTTPSLVVVIDRSKFHGLLRNNYKGVEVAVRDLGNGTGHLLK